MKRSAVVSMCVIGMVALLASGCASAPKGPTDEELVAKVVQDCVASVKAKDFGKVDAYVSSRFSSGAVGDKASLVDLLKSAADMGILDKIEVDLSESKTTIKEGKATVGPINVNRGTRTLVLNFEGAKEDGTWRITNVEPGY